MVLKVFLEEGERGVSIVRSAFLAYHPSLQARLLREVLHRQGVSLHETGTRAVLEFTRTGVSGGLWHFPGGSGCIGNSTAFSWLRTRFRVRIEPWF